MWQLLRLISFRHLARSPLRTLLTLTGIAVGVATMVGVTALNRAVLDSFRSTVETLSGKADLTVAQSGRGFDEATVERVRAVEGVAHASGALTVIAVVKDRLGESLYVLGADLLDDGHFREPRAVDRDVAGLGEDLEFLNSTDRLLLSRTFAERYGLTVGDTLHLLTPTGEQPFTVHALLEEEGAARAFGGALGVMYLGSAQEAFGRGRVVDRIEVAVAPGASVEQVQARLQAALGPTFEIAPPAQRGVTVEKMLRSFRLGLNLGSVVALLVGVFLVFNTLSIGVVQRRRELGTLRALGATRRQVRLLFALEAAFLGLCGTALGIPFGTQLARAATAVVTRTMSAIYVRVNLADIGLRPLELGLAVAVGLGGSVLAALYPAHQASRVPPVEALGRDVGRGYAPATWRGGPARVGLLLLACVWPVALLPTPWENFALGGYLAIFLLLAGVVLLSPLLLRAAKPVLAWPVERLLGTPGRMAAENFVRAPGRTAVPVSALALGVAMSVCMAAFIGSFRASSQRWIEQTVPADLFVTSGAKIGGLMNNPFSPSLGAELEQIPGVAYVDRVRIFAHDVLGLRCFLISLNPDVYQRRAEPEFLAGRMPTPQERRQDFVTISENLARRRNLRPGDTFPLTTPTGVRTYTVSGVIVDYTSDQGSIFLAREQFVAQFQDDRVDTFELYLDDLSVLESVRRQVLSRFGDRFDLFVLSNAELRAEAAKLIDSAFAVTYAMEGVAVLLALLGVINTLLAAVLDRTREIGLLRAVGGSRRHVLGLFTGEAALMGLGGGLLGVVTGTGMGYLLTRVVGEVATGWRLPFHFPAGLALQLLLAATIAAILAGLYPARRAASLDVVEALAYE